MKLHAVEFQNFMLFRSMKKVFSDKEIIGIIAEYMSDPQRSNKGGKTTMVEGILYNLFGVSRAERDVELIHRGEDVMMTKTIWIDGDKKFTIKRGRDIKNNGVLEIKGIEKVREAQEEINALIGYDKEEFMLTNFFKQSDINQFMDMKPTEKKKHLMKWLQNLHWMKLERDALDDLKEVKQEITRCQERIETLIEMHKDNHDIKNEIEELEIDLKDFQRKQVKLEGTVQKYSSGEANKKELRKQLHDVTRRMDDIEDDIEGKERQQRKLKQKQTQLEELDKELKTLGKVTVDDGDRERIADDRASAHAQLDRLNNQIEDAEENMTGTCPILGESCDRVTPDCSTVKTWKIEAKKTKVKVKKMTDQISNFLDFDRAQSDQKDAKAAVELAKSKASGLKPLRAEYDRLKVDRETLEGKMTKVTSTKLIEAQEALDSVRRQSKKLTEKVGSLKGALSNNKKLRVKIDQEKLMLVDLKERVSDLTYVAFMFGKNGIPSQEIENAFDEIEDEANFVLERLGTSLQLEFRPTKELSTWEDTCVECGWQFPKGTRNKTCDDCGSDRQKKRKDELQLRVLENGIDEGFHMESGGGKALVSIAVRIALTRLKQRQSGSRFNVLFLDEPDSAFDEANKKAFTNLITKTLVKDFGFEQVFWISHDKRIQESVPDVLKIQRYENHSKAVWA